MQRRAKNQSAGEIEYIFRHEREIREAVLEAKLGTARHIDGVPSGKSNISDPTYAAAIRLAEEVMCVILPDRTEIKKPERWLKVIGAVREWCKEDTIDNAIFQAVLIQPRKENRRAAREWRDIICSLLNIEPPFYYARIRAICLYRDGVIAGMI